MIANNGILDEVRPAKAGRANRIGIMVFFALWSTVAQASGPTMYGTAQTVANTTAAASSMTLNLPNGGSVVAATTIYIIQAADRAGSPAFSVPAGFTQLCSVNVGSLNEEQIFYKIFAVGSTPPSTVTLTLATSGWTWAGAIAVAYQNVDSNAPFDGGCQTVSQTTTSTSLAGPSVTTVLPDDLVVWGFFVHGDVGTGAITSSPGTSEGEVTRAALSADGYLNYTDLLQASPGASPADTLTWSNAQATSGAIAFALAATAGEDSYGGLLSVPCTNSNTTFSMATVAGKPVLCTPAGHAMFARGPMAMDPFLSQALGNDEYGYNYQHYSTQKFGSVNPAWFDQSLDQLTQYYGFNMVGAESNIYLHPTHVSSRTVPFIWYAIFSVYSLNNELGWGTGYAKPIFRLLSPNWRGYTSGSEIADYYDPNWLGMIRGSLANDTEATDIKNAGSSQRHYIIGFMADDSDNLHCFGAGPDFVTSPTTGNNDFPCGMPALFLAPQAWATSYGCYGCSYGGTIYADPTVYWKRKFRDKLQAKYVTTIALNAAWGSGANYSTFGSSGTCVGSSLTISCALNAPADLVGIGNGSAVTFTHTAAHTAISPFSFGVFNGASLVGGDRGDGTIIGPAIQAGSINYDTGAVSITFTSAPAFGTVITAQYIANGWGKGGTGFMDEDCSGPHASYCGDGSRACIVYFACSAGTQVSPGVQADVNSYTQDIASYYSSTIKTELENWAGSNGFAGNILYLGPTASGTWSSPSSRYVLQGFRGNLDAYAYSGNRPFTQQMLDFFQTYMGDTPLIEDVYKTSNADSELAWPNSSCTYSSGTVTCSLSFPASASQVFSTAQQIDVSCDHSDFNVLEVRPSQVDAVSGGVGKVYYPLQPAPSGSAAVCNVYFSDKNVGGYATQAARGQSYYDESSGLLSASFTADGYRPYIAIQWWDFFADNTEKLTWGWQSIKGNSYDGQENVASSVACKTPLTSYTCGSERNASGNMVTLGRQTHTALDNALKSLH